MIKKILKHPLFSGSTIMVGGSMFVNAINYLYHLLMGRLMGPVGYGTLASLYSILYVVSIVPSSTSFAIVKFISDAETKEKKLVIHEGIKIILMQIAVPVAVVITLLSPLIAKFLHIDEVLSIMIVGPVIFFSLITLANQSTLQGMLKFSGVVIPNFVSGLTKLLFGVILVLMGFSVTGAMSAVLLGVALAYFVSTQMMGSLKGVKPSGKFLKKKFFLYSLPVLIQALAFTSFFTLDILLVKHFLPPFEAGLYAALATLGKIIFFAAQPVTSVMFPIISARRSKQEEYRKVFFAALFMTASISLFATLFYYLFPEIAIGLLYGAKYQKASAELVWMGLFISIYTINYLIVNFLLSINKTKIVLLPLFFALVQGVLIFFFHSSILLVIQASLASSVFLFLSLGAYLGYNEVKCYAKKQN